VHWQPIAQRESLRDSHQIHEVLQHETDCDDQGAPHQTQNFLLSSSIFSMIIQEQSKGKP
jgi:hypothetical protein